MDNIFENLTKMRYMVRCKMKRLFGEKAKPYFTYSVMDGERLVDNYASMEELRKAFGRGKVKVRYVLEVEVDEDHSNILSYGKDRAEAYRNFLLNY